MSLRPIDLQTLIMRQTELSREQAALHDGAVQKKAVEQAESAEETLENQEKVARATELPEGPLEVNDDPDASRESRPKNSRKRKSPAANENAAKEETAETGAEVVKDPMLGRNIDISG